MMKKISMILGCVALFVSSQTYAQIRVSIGYGIPVRVITPIQTSTTTVTVVSENKTEITEEISSEKPKTTTTTTTTTSMNTIPTSTVIGIHVPVVRVVRPVPVHVNRTVVYRPYPVHYH